MPVWKKSKYPGIRYRESNTDFLGVGRSKRPRRYYVMTYKFNGKTKSEGLGWEGDIVLEKRLSEETAHDIYRLLSGNRRDKTPPFTLAAFRQKNEKALEAKVKAEQEEKARNMSFTEVFEFFLVESKEKKKNPRSWKREEQLARLHIFPVMGDLPLSKIANVPQLKTLQKHMETKGLSPASIRYALHVVRIVFHFALDEGYFTGINPALERSKKAISKNRTGIEYPQEDNKKERWLSREESTLLMQELAKRSGEVRDMAMLALYAGLRFGEIAKLTWGNVDLFKGEMKLKQTKNGKDRVAYINPDVQEMFARRGLGESDRLVFPARGTDNKPHYMISHIYYDTVKKLFNHGITNKKEWVNFHTLRHTFASWLVENGTDIYKVQELLGHGDLKMTERYAHNKQEQLKQAVMRIQNG